MSQSLSRIRNLYKYEDGDQIEARMGVQIDAGYGLTQYWDEQQGRVVNTDFTQHPPVLYPYPYSSKRGQYVVPATQGQQWYYNNPESETAGILDENAHLENILDLTVEDILRRRLQTIVFQKGLARTAKEARMFVVHGHIALDGKKVNSPSYVVKKGEEDLVGFYPTSPVAKQIEEYNAAKADDNE